ncbi:MAG: heme d1 biosynthesis radical SAM protein NirJ [Magnetococcus sp. WYHC-3]
MLRLSRILHQAQHPDASPAQRRVPQAGQRSAGPVVIWNLTRRCNLTCTHCYASSADRTYPGETPTTEIDAILGHLRDYRVPALILSGGEPLLHPDLEDIIARAKSLGFHVGVSSNGMGVDAPRARRFAHLGVDYLGISLDGLGEVHDRFRNHKGAFDAALTGLRHARDAGLAVGMRFTLTGDNACDFPGMLELMQREAVGKFYLSHLNYAGRGARNAHRDARFDATRQTMESLFAHAWAAVAQGDAQEFVTGNNDADGVFLLHWLARHHPGVLPRAHALLQRWGGNASGVHVANIDPLGQVHPDTMWWDVTLGNARERPFGDIWDDRSHAIMDGLKQRPRPLGGRCGVCAHQTLCNGNSRIRAWRTFGDPWAEDPGCYLHDEECQSLPVTTDLLCGDTP